MGQKCVIIHNKLSVEVRVMVTHSSGNYDVIRIHPHDMQSLKTEQGQVFVSVYDQFIEVDEQDPYEDAHATHKIFSKELHFYIEEDARGYQRIVNEATRKKQERAKRKAAKKISP